MEEEAFEAISSILVVVLLSVSFHGRILQFFSDPYLFLVFSSGRRFFRNLLTGAAAYSGAACTPTGNTIGDSSNPDNNIQEK
jgi:hypothetical protein